VSLEHLLGALTREAEAEAAAILATARDEAAAVRTAGESTRTARRESALAVREAELRTALEQALVGARQQARRDALEARLRVLERVWSKARTLFPETLERADYRRALPAQITEAFGCLGHRVATLRYHPTLRDIVEPAAIGIAQVRPVADDTVGSGFTLVSDDGTMEVNGTMEGLLARLHPRVALDVVAALEQSA
jgi:vacuolar-type H+-ATPase subunit E/Vma4